MTTRRFMRTSSRGAPTAPEVRVQAERAPEPPLRRHSLAEAALDHPAVEQLERVVGPEPERTLRELPRLAAAAVPLQRPREDVVAVDRRPLALREACEPERRAEPDSVVDVE